MSLKLATMQDEEAVLRMCHSFYSSSPFHDKVQYNPQKVVSLLRHSNETQRRDALFLLYEFENQAHGLIIAIASTTPFSDDLVASELAWWVDEEYRGHKESMDLIHAYHDWARVIGCKHTTMALLSSTNPKVEKYYERLGYEKTEISFIKSL